MCEYGHHSRVLDSISALPLSPLRSFDSFLVVFVKAKEMRFESFDGSRGGAGKNSDHYNLFRSSVGLPLWRPHGRLQYSIFIELRARNWPVATVSLQVSGYIAILVFCLDKYLVWY